MGKQNGNGDNGEPDPDKKNGNEELEPKPDKKEGNGDDRKFAQSDVDRIVKERLARESKKYEDYDDLKAKAAELDKLKDAEKTDLEKAKEATAKAERERDEAQLAANDTLIKAAFIAEASKVGAAHPEDAYALADLSGVTIEDGKVSGVAEAVKSLVKDKRLPMSSKLAPDLEDGEGEGKGEKTKPLTAEEKEIARKMGLSDEQYSKSKDTPSLAPMQKAASEQGKKE